MSRLASRLAVLVAIAAGCATPAAAQNSQFKGLPAISRELTTRIAPRGMSVELDWFLPAPGLDGLLGSWSSFGSEHAFRNGTPNALSMVIWQVTLTNFAQSLGKWCETPSLTFANQFAWTLGRLCAWPRAEATDEAVMLSFWVSLMGYSAPREEYEAWRSFFLTSSYAQKPAREVIPAMALAITLNPYFLLHR